MVSKDFNALRDCFLGENVVFYLRDMNVAAISPEGDEMSISSMVTGYVVDIDKLFYYIGTPEGDVAKVISHDVIGMVEVVQFEAADLPPFLIGGAGDPDGEMH